jgi:uncharacterized membrane protein YfhO
VINQNYDWGWRVRGGQAESFNGLLSTQVEPGDTQVTFYYLPSSFIMGILVSLLSVLLFIYWDKAFGWIRKRTGKAARVRRR